MLKRFYPPLSLLGLLTTLIFPAHAGLVVNGTRFIFSGKQQSMAVQVKNESDARNLVVIKILPDDGASTAGSTGERVQKTAPFVAAPPLFPLAPRHENIIRLMRTGGDLPEDRESLFWLSVAGIPGTNQKAPANTLEVAIRSKMKLFYRPAGVVGKEEEAYKNLLWSRAGAAVTVKNASPFYVTLYNFSVNGRPNNAAGMVPPFATRTQPWCPASGECALQWQTINDYGGVMPALRLTVNSTPQKGQ